MEARLLQPRILIATLALLSALVHFVALSQPRDVVFDEVHFGRFVTAYCCNHENIFDIHPPHGKLLIAAGAKVLGYRGGFDFEHIGQLYPDHVTPAALRFMPALAGFFIPLIAFGLLRQLGTSPLFAFVGALALLLDNALVLQSRVIALDSMLIVATLGSISAYLAARGRDKAVFGWLILSGALAGLAIGVKFTGLAALGIVGLLVIAELVRAKSIRELGSVVVRGLTILGAAAVVYALGWAMHYVLLVNPGPGDVWQRPSGNMVRDAIEMHQIMFDANYNLNATHPYSSEWWGWMSMYKPVFYWQGGSDRLLYFIGNPVVWWGAAVLFLSGLFHTLLVKKKVSGPLAVLLLAYAVSFAPFVGVPRALFLYHYLTPMIFSLLFGIVWADQYVRSQGSYEKHRSRIAIIAIILIIFGFITYSPLTYGFAAGGWTEALFIAPGWR